MIDVETLLSKKLDTYEVSICSLEVELVSENYL